MDWKVHLETYKRKNNCNTARLLFEQVTKWQDPHTVQFTRSLYEKQSITSKPTLSVVPNKETE